MIVASNAKVVDAIKSNVYSDGRGGAVEFLPLAIHDLAADLEVSGDERTDMDMSDLNME